LPELIPVGYSIEIKIGRTINFVEKNFNGELGYLGVAVKGFQNIPNDLKRDAAYKLSKLVNIKSGRIFQRTKGFVNGAGKVAKKLGPIGTGLSILSIGYDIADDGQVKTSSLINGGLLTVGLIFPVTAPFIVAYGILDYTFDIGDKLDDRYGSVNTYIYE